MTDFKVTDGASRLANNNAPPESLRTLIDYDAETGAFVWTSRAHKLIAGKKCAPTKKSGYMRITFKRRSYSAHRLAWWFVNGAMPTGDIDHINGDRADNRMANLRMVTNAENQHSVFKPQSNNKSTGVRGVSRHGKGYQSRIKVDGKSIHLGKFETTQAASAAYLAAKASLHPASALASPHLSTPLARIKQWEEGA